MNEYSYEKNVNLDLDRITIGSNAKIWWKCTLGHEWQATVGSRSKGAGCPYCSNYKAWAGYNDLATVNPKLASEWCYEKNGGLRPTSVTVGSHKKVWWKCNNGHEWEAEIKSRSVGSGCPYCSGRFAVKGVNDLQTVDPAISEEWDFEKNGELTPSEVLPNSGMKVWWRCKEGHEWQTTVSDRSKGNGCPYCGGKKVLKGFNDLQTRYPVLSEEWDWEKNKTRPEDHTAFSSGEVWWKCKEGHSWKAAIYSRTYGANKCPICSNHMVLKGYNDLESNNPQLLKEWNWDRNTVLPSEISPYSDKKVWWKCKKGHEWESTVGNRSAGTKCPHCSFYGSSFIEMALFYYLKQIFPDAQYRIKIGCWEADIYIPSINTAIEYDGGFFHSGSVAYNRDTMKTNYFSEKGITLIRIRACGIPDIEGCKIIYHNSGKISDLSEIMQNLLIVLEIYGEGFDIDTSRDYDGIMDVYSNYYKKEELVV